MKKLFGLILRNRSILLFIVLALLALAISYFRRNEKGMFDAAFWISASIAFVVIPLDKSLRIIGDYRRFNKLSGTYDTYGYQRDSVVDGLGPDNSTYEQFQANNKEDEEKQSNRANWIDQENKKYNLLNDQSSGTAILEYKGTGEFTIIHAQANSQNTWKGSLKFQAANMGSIAWHYSAPPSLKDCAGYKKAVVIEDVTPTKIYLFSDDGQRFGREVLIKS